MFKCGDLIVYGNNGVCEVTAIAPLASSTDNRLYYALKNKISNGVAYVPVDSGVYMRPVMSKEEANNLIKEIPNIKTNAFSNVGIRDAGRVYREALQSYDSMQVISLIKHIVENGEIKRKLGKKLTSTEERFLEQARRIIESELAVALNIEIEEVEKVILKSISKHE